MAFDTEFGAVDGDTRTLRAAMTVPPPPGRLWQIDQTIRQLKQHGIWQKLDVLWVLAAHDAQAARLNWKAPASFALTAVNSPTFTADRGYAGNGTTSYLNTGWAPSTNGVQFTQNNAAIAQYINASSSDTESTAFANMGAVDATGGGYALNARRSTGGMGIRVNGTNIASSTGSGLTTRFGLSLRQRTGASAEEAFKNGSSIGTGTDTSAARIATQGYICAFNNNGTPGGFTTDRAAMVLLGSSFTSAQNAALYRITQNFLASMGAAV